MRNKESEKLFKLAYTDAMTGLYNRAAYEERLAKLRRSTARLDNIMVVVAEIDDLFTIDDTAGKMVGDDVVKTMDMELAVKQELYHVLDDNIDKGYFEEVKKQVINPSVIK